ncbi:hypothetical protein RI129_004090 [Pyrocoelia pectoralis]|uniref:Sperm-tail PG-rich repeat-containing protein 2 n=1 Tax=Pyrocoelia pectoralis TaxID=417401 RepID=A0AAN7VHC9_9COLE
MFNLASRFTKTNTATPPGLGPNSYTICDAKEYLGGYHCTLSFKFLSARITENRIPFLSSNIRNTTKTLPVYTHAIYHPEEHHRPRIKGGASLIYTAKRLKYNKDDAPGPCDYDPEVTIFPRQVGVGRVYLCRVPYSVSAKGPSVPSHLDENGYDIDDDGNLIKLPANVYDTSRGPARYNVPRGEFCYTTNKYHKGNWWSKSNTIRFPKQMSTTPGVGEYNLKTVTLSEGNEEYREMARLFSFLPRFTEAEMLRIEREDTPGPGSYNVDNSSFTRKESLSVTSVPFITGAARLSSGLKYETPAPGDYEVQHCPVGRRDFSKRQYIGAQAARFVSGKQQQYPSPNTYNVPNPIDVKIKAKSNRFSRVKVPFCVLAERKMGFVHKDAPDFPGPAEYDIQTKEITMEYEDGPCFKSRSKRFTRTTKTYDAGPASYDITEPFKKNTNRKSHNTGKVPFLSSELRSTKLKSKTPGPSEYSTGGILGMKGLSFGHALRFKDKCDDLPGPGQYTLHPSVGLSVYKGVATHNLRLKENVTRTKMRLPPSATRNIWASQMKKQRKLRWFSKPTTDYIHCVPKLK